MKRRMTMLACLAALLLPAGASAQSKPIRIIVPFAVGGASDTYTRLVAQKITEQTGKNIVVENKTGAGGRIAFDYAAKSPADAVRLGYLSAVGRQPSADELAGAVEFLSQQAASYSPGDAKSGMNRALIDFCQVLFCLNEFIYAD